MVTVHFTTRDLGALADPSLIARAEAQMIEAGVDVLQPLARDEVPRRTGKGAGAILGVVERRGGKPVGRVHAGKAFYLRILATGAKPHAIAPYRYKSKRKSRTAARALGPGVARGAVGALRFKIAGAYIFRARVEHPGLKPDNFFERAARRGEAAVGNAAELVVQRALDQATRA